MTRGFTLIETLITVALFVVLILAVTQLSVVYGHFISLQKSSIGITLGGSSIMDAVRTAGLQADHVVASHIFSGVAYTSGTTTAIFELPAIDASGATIANTYDYIGIFASGTNVYRLTDAAAGSARVSGEKQLTSALDALSFTYDSASFPAVASVTVDATTSALIRGDTAQTHLREHLYLRNL